MLPLCNSYRMRHVPDNVGYAGLMARRRQKIELGGAQRTCQPTVASRSQAPERIRNQTFSGLIVQRPVRREERARTRIKERTGQRRQAIAAGATAGSAGIA